MPYGLANPPSFFQAFKNEVFRDMLHTFVMVYLDNFLIYAKHTCHVRQVLRQLLAHRLHAKALLSKVMELYFLGYRIVSRV